VARKRKPKIPKEALEVIEEHSVVAAEAERAVEKPENVVCPCCHQVAYTVLRSRLDEVAEDGELRLEDLTPVSPQYRKVTGSIQLDCPLCAYDIFVRNPRGGYNIHLEKGLYPREYGSRPGLRLRQHHYMDPLGTYASFREALFH
jgi:hypothetical protein